MVCVSRWRLLHILTTIHCAVSDPQPPIRNSITFAKIPRLHVVCYKNNVPVAEVLLRHGADPHRQMLREGNLNDPTPFSIAQRNKSQESGELFATRTQLSAYVVQDWLCQDSIRQEL